MIDIKLNPGSVVLRLTKQEYAVVKNTMGRASELVEYKSESEPLKAIYSIEDCNLYLCVYIATRCNMSLDYEIDQSRPLLFVDEEFFMVTVEHDDFIKIMRQYEWFTRNTNLQCDICKPFPKKYNIKFSSIETDFLYDAVCWINNNIKEVVLR